MADTRKFQIEVSSTFNPAGTQAANTALTGVTKSTADLTDATKESAKGAEHSGLSHRALHQILHLIASQSGPAAGAAIAGGAAP